MNVDLAVVRLPYRPGSGPVRTGTVLLQEDDLYLVRWDDDGSEEEVHLGDYESVVQRGSLRYLATVDCERFRAVFDADPLPVVLRVLAENDGPMTAKTLRIYLVNLGLDKNVLTSKWPKVAKHLLSRDGITVVGEGSARTYAWFGEDLPDLSPVAGVEQMQAPTRDGDEPAPAKREPVELGMPAGGLATEAVSVADPSPDVEQSESGVSPSRETAAAPPAAEPTTAETAGRDPVPPPVEPNVLTLAELIEAAAEQIRATDGLEPAQIDALADILRRCADSGGDLPAPVLPELVQLTTAVASGGVRYSDVVEAVAPHIAQLLRRAGETAKAKLDIEALARIAGRLPLAFNGGRVAILQAVNLVWPDRVAEPEWWTGGTLAELAAAARGVLGAVTARTEVAEQVVRPLMLREASAATTFLKVTELLTMPREFVAQLPADAVASAFRRVAGEDLLVASWLRALAGSERVEVLEGELTKARAETAAAEQAMLASQSRADELAARCTVLEDALHSEHTEAVRLRFAQDRQVRIGAVRKLASLAAEVEELATEHTDPGVLVGRVRDLAVASDLEALGAAGEEFAFDPSLHDPIVGSPESGTLITVIRPGYRWRPDGDDILLDKALVTTT